MSKPTVVVWGGAGALGQEIVSELKKENATVISVDLRANSAADQSVVIKSDGTKEDAQSVLDAVQKVVINGVDALICVAGGFEMGSFNSPDIFAQLEKMYAFNVRSSFASSWVASHTLNANGLLVLTGAWGAFNKPTPFLSAYGAAKAATHHLTTSLAASTSDFKQGVSVVCMLPVMLDTPMNRSSAGPNDKFDDWTPLNHIASLISKWTKGQERPANGSFVKVTTQSGETSTSLVQ
ncbi:hypothetical protein PROFUN_00362 [Planoprotostelium fungivorum]|uniref:Dihydropteridine reductase n=1 Tax=Planoprotostelium fungivorum TaxID=1890364 RepID=A0A2P6NY58_9EUKA|nr:hypothetical protein PROFUN_00362 [Planoprotostelium fungivorum]